MVDGNTLLVGTSVTGDRDLDRSRFFQQPGHRELATVKVRVKFKGGRPNTTYKVKLKFTASDGTTVEKEVTITTDNKGEATADIEIDDKFLNPTKTDVCNDCSLEEEEVECPATGCDEDINAMVSPCLLYTSPSPRDGLLSRMPSSA